MISERVGGMTVFRFAVLARYPELVHGVFSRSGGASAPPFDSLNVTYGGGDDDGCVGENRELIASWTGGMELVALHQVHGARVHVAGPGAAAEGGRPPSPPAADAAVTRAPNRALLIQVADCQPVLIFDPRRRVAAAVHSGWRGSIGNVIGRTVAVMIDDFGCSPRDMVAGIGPSLGPCCAEFIHYRRELPETFWRFRRGTHHFDFWAASRAQLTVAGLANAAIETGAICTRCHPRLFFSYRRAHRTGRFGAVIGLRP